MPGDYAERLDDREITALAAFVAAASRAEAGNEDEDEDDEGGRNRGRGRGRRGGLRSTRAHTGFGAQLLQRGVR